MNIEKTYINAQELLEVSAQMALNIYHSGFRPNYIVGVWRGGAPIGIVVQEALECLGIESDHISIRTSSYQGMAKRSKEVKVHGLNYLTNRLESEDSLLIVDDVHDSGLSIAQAIADLKGACKKNTPEIRIATPYFKPDHNKTDNIPDYYIHATNEWLVFPHELEGLSKEEIVQNKPGFAEIAEEMEHLGNFS